MIAVFILQFLEKGEANPKTSLVETLKTIPILGKLKMGGSRALVPIKEA